MTIRTVLIAGALFLLPLAAQAATATPAPSLAASPSPMPSVMPSPEATPVDTPSLNPPPMWVYTPNHMTFGSTTILEFWYAPDKSGDNINLGFTPNTGATLAGAVTVSRASLAAVVTPGTLSDQAEKVCNGTTDGWLFRGEAVFGRLTVETEETMLVTQHDVFFAAYTRRKGHPEDPAARKAIDSLCAKINP